MPSRFLSRRIVLAAVAAITVGLAAAASLRAAAPLADGRGIAFPPPARDAGR